MSSLIERDGWWYLWTSVGGRRRKKSLKTQDKTVAKKLQRIYDAQMATNKTGIAPGKLNIEAEWERFLEWKKPTMRPVSFTRYVNIAKHWNKYLESVSISTHDLITSEVVSDYVRNRTRAGKAEKTIFDEVATLKSMIRHASDEGRCEAPRFAGWPRLKKRPKIPERLGYYSLDEIRLLREHFANSDFLPVLMIGLHTGCRLGELRAMKVRDVRLSENILMIPNLKSGHNSDTAFRRVEIHPALRGFLEALVLGKGLTAPLIPAMQLHGHAWAREALRWACSELGIQYKRYHGVRHTFITHALASGLSLRDLMDIVGHENLETVNRYLHSAEALRGGKMAKVNLG